jgi:hypothetical protein
LAFSLATCDGSAHMPFWPPNLMLKSTKYARPTALNQLRE